MSLKSAHWVEILAPLIVAGFVTACNGVSIPPANMTVESPNTATPESTVDPTVTVALTPTSTQIPTATPSPTPSPLPSPTPVGGGNGKAIFIWGDKRPEGLQYSVPDNHLFELVVSKSTGDYIYQQYTNSSSKITTQRIEQALGRKAFSVLLNIAPDGKGLIISLCELTRSGCAPSRVYISDISLSYVYEIPADVWMWSPSGKSAISLGASLSSSIYFVEQNSGDAKRIFTKTSARGYFEPAFSPDETKVYLVDDTHLWEIDVTSSAKREITLKDIEYSRLESLAFSPDGSQIALWVRQEDYYLYVAQPDFSDFKQALKIGQQFNSPSVQWFPDGGKLLAKYYYCGSGGCGGGNMLADVINLASGDVTSLPKGLTEICGWSPDQTLWFVYNYGPGLTLTYKTKPNEDREKNYLYDGICPQVWLSDPK